MFESIWRDIGYALRSLMRTPAFAVAATVTLALGIGANTTIFSLMNAVGFRTLPVVAPHELYFVALGVGRDRTISNYAWLESVRGRTDVFTGVAGYNVRNFKVASEAGQEQVVGQYVSGNFHAVAGVPIARGRGFAAEDDRAAGGSPIAVISDGYWARRFDRDPRAIGASLVVGGRPVTIVGITASGFTGMQPGRAPEITLPLSIRAADEPRFLTSAESWTNMPLLVRLRPGVNVQQAQAALEATFRAHLTEHRIRRIGLTAAGELRSVLVPAARGHDRLRNEYATPLGWLMGMVGLVLLISCVNVANLLLARGTARAGELGVRISVGASRARLVRQLVTESVILAAIGGALGLLLASWGTWFIAAFLLESQNPIVLDAQPDTRVLGFTALLSLSSAIVFGVVPAITATRFMMAPALRHRSVRVSPASRWRGRQLLVATQIALCLVLVFGAGLLVRTQRNLERIDGGFVTDDLLIFALDANDTTFPLERMATVCGAAVERLRSRSGSISGACSTMSPVDTAFEGRTIGIPTPPPGPNANQVSANAVTPDYFRTFGIALVRGRLFTGRDTGSAPRVALVNETAARAFFGDSDPIGRPIAFGSNPDPARAMTIVGIVHDAKQGLRQAFPPMVYQPLAQLEDAPDVLTGAIRTTGDPGPLAGEVRREVNTLNRDVAVTWVRTMRQQIAAALTSERLLATLSTWFGLLALVLACIGLYGVVAYDVARRSRDIGIRLALGAERSTVLMGVLRQTATITAAGLLAGLAAASIVSAVVEEFLFGLTPRDPLTLSIATGVLALSALLAGYVPAHRAARIEPAETLRSE